jgi:hypothetical protein
MRWFDVRAPDGRELRTKGESREALKLSLAPGYEIVSEVYAANARGEGGYAASLEGKSLLSVLLDAHGDELEAWLKARGFANHIS